MTDKIDMNTDEVQLIAANLYAGVIDSGAIDIHSQSAVWLDKTGEKLYMKIGKVLSSNG